MAKKLYGSSFFAFYWDKILGKAWDRFKDNWLTLVLALLATVAIAVGTWLLFFALMFALATGGGGGAIAALLTFLFAVAGIVLGVTLASGWIKLTLNITDHNRGDVSDLFSQASKFFSFVAVMVLYGLIVVGGTVLLVVPGVYWGLMFMWAPILVVDKGLGPIEALKRSAEITDGAKWDLFLYKNLEFGMVYMASVSVVGLILAWPLATLAQIEMYRHVQK